MHKFTDLRVFTFRTYGIRPNPLNQNILSRFLSYMHKIRYYDVKEALVIREIITEAIMNHWNTNSAVLGSQFVDIVIYADNLLSPSINISNINLSLSLPSSRVELINFIQRNGLYVGKLRLRYTQRLNRFRLPVDFVTRLFRHCHNLRSLRVEKFISKKFDLTTADLGRKHSLDELCLADCIIERSALEQVSLLIPRIKQLYLSGNLLHRVDQSTPPTTFDVIVKDTAVDTIVIEGADHSQVPYIKIFNNAEGTSHYITVFLHRMNKITRV